MPSVRPVLAWALAVFAVNAALAQWLFAHGAFADFNRLFETDPNVRLGEIASGWSAGGELHWRLPQSLHALMPYLFSLPLRALGAVAHAAGLGGSAEAARNLLGLLVVPAANALSAALLALLYRRIGLVGWRWLAANLLTLLTFSNLVFGSVPDHFALTRACALALLWLVAVEAEGGARPRGVAGGWMAAAVITPGITATNASFVATSRFIALLAAGRRPLAAAWSAVGLATAGLVFAVAVGTGLALLRYGSSHAAASHLTKWMTGPTPERVAATFAAIGESFVPLRVVDIVNTYNGHVWPTLVLESTLRVSPPSLALAALVLLLTAWGGWRLAAAGGWRRWLAAAAALQFAQVLMFFIWGDTPFLYSAHWIAGQQVLLAGLLLPEARPAAASDRLATAAAVALVVAAGASSLIAWRFVVQAVLHPAG